MRRALEHYENLRGLSGWKKYYRCSLLLYGCDMNKIVKILFMPGLQFQMWIVSQNDNIFDSSCTEESICIGIRCTYIGYMLHSVTEMILYRYSAEYEVSNVRSFQG